MPRPPKVVATFFSYFPLKTYPPIEPTTTTSNARPTKPTLWISPPRQGATSSDITSTTSLLSADVECLKWQAYLALRGLSNVQVRWDICPEGALESRLPNLHLPKDEGEKLDVDLAPAEQGKKGPVDSSETKLYLYSAPMIPSWVDLKLGVDSVSDPLEGYIHDAARDESRAWVSLLEGTVHGALILFSENQASLLSCLLSSTTKSSASAEGKSNPLQTILSPPPAPLSGFTSLLPAFGTRVNPTAVLSQYREAIASLSERLGTDKWFLNSSTPTPLDALAFAYLHCLLTSQKELLRFEVSKHPNLVAWEWKAREHVKTAFVQ